MTAINAGGTFAHRVDVIAYEISVLFLAGQEGKVNLIAAFMMAGNAGDFIVRRVDVDALQVEPDPVAGSGILRAFDSLSGSGRFAAHGCLCQRIARAETEHGKRDHQAYVCGQATSFLQVPPRF